MLILNLEFNVFHRPEHRSVTKLFRRFGSPTDPIGFHGVKPNTGSKSTNGSVFGPKSSVWRRSGRRFLKQKMPSETQGEEKKNGGDWLMIMVKKKVHVTESLKRHEGRVGEEWEAAEHVVCSSFSVLSVKEDSLMNLWALGLGFDLKS